MSLRKEKELDYIHGVEATEAHSVFARREHAVPLTNFLRAKGVSVTVIEDALGGDDEQDEINGAKDISFATFMGFVNEWKKEYAK